MIIFDSTFLIDLMLGKNNPKLKKCKYILNDIVESEEIFATTFVSVLEIHNGAYGSENAEKEINKINEILKVIPVLKFDDMYYSQYGKLSSYLKKKGTPIGKFDELIAAIALCHNAKILTNNTRDFSRVPKLKIIDH
ncbi:type II toxin-antitoxin system VapC family toxin [Methanoplanus endosymbiosus]|uniref:Type II toxin-antitoxin system VapC family toxin n=1 Tax=Methanoplanus endosymbiosus TaxID=33865 RepID=A0A9E7THB8_9EURY|nr:type II toxin-antitoxin system VapC family toxin [Methanoplanus endosymbiosus]UUX92547.1 type II toxin-antitoxin system VapC family toxin [Methanoplanus endosymbiosus]